jgi:hypothetical protein
MGIEASMIYITHISKVLQAWYILHRIEASNITQISKLLQA